MLRKTVLKVSYFDQNEKDNEELNVCIEKNIKVYNSVKGTGVW